jgi:hypothetical protein
MCEYPVGAREGPEGCGEEGEGALPGIPPQGAGSAEEIDKGDPPRNRVWSNVTQLAKANEKVLLYIQNRWEIC